MLNTTDQNTPSKLKVWIPLLLSLMLVVGMLIGMRMQKIPLISTSTGVENAANNRVETGRLEELIRYVEAQYVDEVDREEMIEDAINQLLSKLDPHSNYISASQVKEVNEQLEGNFEGVGIEFMILEDTIRVISPISGGPSEAVGIIAGDKIVQIEDSIVAGVGIKVKDIVGHLRGERGSEVRVGILRGNEKTVRDFSITRDEIPINSVDVSYMLDDKTGYIKVSRFSATTYKEFMKGLEDMVENQGMKDLVIDLRQNPGGYLQEATNMLSQLFRERDKLLVYTEGRSVRRSEYESTGRPFFEIGEIAVLIDEGSASASEIVAGAVQDWDRGVVVGRRSFGKGLVQEQYSLRDGSALRLTVARYYTPSGRCIQKSYTDRDHYDDDVKNRLNKGELLSADSIAIEDTTKFYTADGRVVYGGGGITPDVFIPLDTLLLNDYFIALRQLIPQFVFKEVESIGRIYDGDIEAFRREFNIDNGTLDRFLAYANDKEVKTDLKQWASCQSSIKKLLKARFARHYFQEAGYYKIWNEFDPSVLEALKQLEEKETLMVEER